MGISLEELQLAARNHALPLETLRDPITPPGLHYLLIHFDIPAVDADSYRLTIDGLVERPVRADARRHPRVRGQRARAARAAMAKPTVAERGCRDRGVDGDPAATAA